MDEFAAAVEAYSRDRGLLPPCPHASRVAGYLTMSPDDYDTLSGAALSKIHLDVTSFAHLVQQELNFQESKAERCRYRIARLVERKLGRYKDSFKTEDKRLAASLDDPEAAAYLDILKNCECFLKRWDGEVDRLDAYCKSVSNMVYAKGK